MLARLERVERVGAQDLAHDRGALHDHRGTLGLEARYATTLLERQRSESAKLPVDRGEGEEVAVHALNSAKVREANASVGVRHVAADCSPQGVERRRKAVPFYRHTVIKAGQGAAVTEDTCLLTFDFYLVTHRAAPDAVVAAVLKAVWEQVDALGAFHPFLKQWTRERAVDPDVTVPYHPAAIPFYRERGAWSPKMDEAQQKLLALNP